MDIATLALSESLAVTYRYDRFSVSSRTSFGNEGLLAQSFRASAPFGDLSLQGSVSFTSTQFSRTDLSVSGRSGGVAYAVTLLVAELGTQTQSAIGAGMTIRIAGVIEGFARVSTILGLGATPYGQIEEPGCVPSFAGIRLSLTDLELCGGQAALDFLFGQTGLASENISWSGALPIPLLDDFTFRASARFSDLFTYESTSLSIGGMVGDHAISASFAYDTSSTRGDLADFVQGSFSVRSPLFGGQILSTASFDSDSLLALSFNWARAFEAWSINVTPTFEIIDQYEGGMEFDIPSAQVTLRFDLACCIGQPAAELGDLTLSLSVSKTGFDRVVVSHTFPF
ncbi:MAG: hypothetical protein PHU43_04315 [Candidatus Bipolaricaulis sp.]|nr:hypothetical protein [Candidatus Bipolaricaulis sp.]